MSLACSWTHVDSLDYVCNSFHSCHGFAVQLARQFHCSVFGMVLQRFCTWFERCCNLCCTKVWRWSNDVAVKGLKKDGIAIWNTPAAEDHNMFVCCMFLELGLKLSWTWTVIELFLNLLSWSSCSSFLSVFGRSCGLVCRLARWFACPFSLQWPAVWSSWTGCSRSVEGSLMQRKSKPAALGRSGKGHATWCNYVVINVYQAHISALTKAVQSSATRCFGLITKGFEDNTTEELLDLEVQKPRFQVEKRLRNDLKTLFQFVLDCVWMILVLRGLGFPRSQARGVDTWCPWGSSQYPKVWQPRSCPEERSLTPVPLT